MIKQMTGLKSLSGLLGVLLALGFFVAPAVADKMKGEVSHHEGTEEMADKAEMDIVETAVAAGKFETLVAAVKAAGLVETLSGEQEFTVFAPTDEAFAALGEENLEKLLKPENKEKLTAILTYHVVPGVYKSGDLEDGKVKTVQGSEVEIELGDSVMVDDATVVTPDVMTSNGVIHIIDKVIIPSEE
uniref:fasciclin domain-containing protein n=1 Tax=Crocosphaera sp. Alani8 TaxID=3038952 RepID=UPI00313B59E3